MYQAAGEIGQPNTIIRFPRQRGLRWRRSISQLVPDHLPDNLLQAFRLMCRSGCW
jgi:hypothetical protein